MVKVYFTFGTDQPGYPGCVEVVGEDVAVCRAAMFDFTDGRFCGQYPTPDAVHPNDRFVRVRIDVKEDGTYETELVGAWLVTEEKKD